MQVFMAHCVPNSFFSLILPYKYSAWLVVICHKVLCQPSADYQDENCMYGNTATPFTLFLCAI
jgi:hypothetical protein